MQLTKKEKTYLEFKDLYVLDVNNVGKGYFTMSVDEFIELEEIQLLIKYYSLLCINEMRNGDPPQIKSDRRGYYIGN